MSLPVCRGWPQHFCKGMESFLLFSDGLVFHWGTIYTCLLSHPVKEHSDQTPPHHSKRKHDWGCCGRNIVEDTCIPLGRYITLTSMMVTATSFILWGSTYEFWQLSVSRDANSLWLRLSNCSKHNTWWAEVIIQYRKHYLKIDRKGLLG